MPIVASTQRATPRRWARWLVPIVLIVVAGILLAPKHADDYTIAATTSFVGGAPRENRVAKVVYRFSGHGERIDVNVGGYTLGWIYLPDGRSLVLSPVAKRYLTYPPDTSHDLPDRPSPTQIHVAEGGRTIAGYPCRHYTIDMKDPRSAAGDVTSVDGWFAPTLRLTQPVREPTGASWGIRLPLQRTLGYPMAISVVSGSDSGRFTYTETVTSVTRRPIPAAEFAPPPNYRAVPQRAVL